jgi:hypothetical protein
MGRRRREFVVRVREPRGCQCPLPRAIGWAKGKNKINKRRKKYRYYRHFRLAIPMYKLFFTKIAMTPLLKLFERTRARAVFIETKVLG